MFSTDCAKSFGLTTNLKRLTVPISSKSFSSLRISTVKIKHRMQLRVLTVSTFFVVSFWDREISSSFNS